jgi:hypothetical protein
MILKGAPWNPTQNYKLSINVAHVSGTELLFRYWKTNAGK